METSRKNTIRAFSALFLLTLIWGYNWVVMKTAVQYATPFQFTALRTTLGAIVLFIVMAAGNRPLKLQEFPTMLLLGLLQTCGFTGLLIWALVHGGAGKTAVLSYTMPFWVMLFAWPILGEKVKGWQWLAVILAIAGITLVFEPQRFFEPDNHYSQATIISMVMALFSGVFWAISAIVSKKLNKRRPDLDVLNITAWPMLLGSIPIIVLALILPAPAINWHPNFIASVVYSMFLSGALAWVCWAYALQHLPAGSASMGSMLAPVIGVLSAWLQLGEVPSQIALVGMLLVAIALILISAVTIRKHQAVCIAEGQE